MTKSGQTTVSINGGLEVPMETVDAAMKLVKGECGRLLGTQGDIEDLTGRDPANAEKARNIAGERLRSIIERIERLEEERKALSGDIKDIFSEAKSAGFDVKVIRQLIRIRRQEPAEVDEQETLLDVYRRAIGM